MSTLKALIFDVDGTLADTERDGHRIAFNRAFIEAGLDWHWDVPTYSRLLQVTGGKERILHFVNHELAASEPLFQQAEFIRDLHASKTRHYIELLNSGTIPLRPGVEHLVKEARAKGLRLGIATTTTPENVTALLSVNLGVNSVEWFDAIAAGDMVPNKKPAPDVYQLALQQLGLPPVSCLAIEDSEHGLHSAVGAGLKTLITYNGYTQQQDFSAALEIVESLDQVGDGSLAGLERLFEAG